MPGIDPGTQGHHWLCTTDVAGGGGTCPLLRRRRRPPAPSLEPPPQVPPLPPALPQAHKIREKCAPGVFWVRESKSDASFTWFILVSAIFTSAFVESICLFLAFPWTILDDLGCILKVYVTSFQPIRCALTEMAWETVNVSTSIHVEMLISLAQILFVRA